MIVDMIEQLRFFITNVCLVAVDLVFAYLVLVLFLILLLLQLWMSLVGVILIQFGGDLKLNSSCGFIFDGKLIIAAEGKIKGKIVRANNGKVPIGQLLLVYIWHKVGSTFVLFPSLTCCVLRSKDFCDNKLLPILHYRGLFEDVFLYKLVIIA